MTSSPPARLSEINVWRVTIPFRFNFSHHLASRNAAETLLVEIKTAGGGVGYGQALPRAYLTGETLDSAAADIQKRWWPAFAAMRPDGKMSVADLLAMYGDSFRLADALRLNASYAAVDMAATAAWGNAGGVIFPQWERRLPLVGVVSAMGPRKAHWLAKILYLCGYRHFKVKVGDDPAQDLERLRAVRRAVGGGSRIILDANAAWRLDEVERRVAELAEGKPCLLEEPLRAEDAGRADYHYLEKVGQIPIMADESLCTLADGKSLLNRSGPSWWNVRLAKNGGFAGIAALAKLAAKDVRLYGGILVGESGALAAAGRAGMYLTEVEMGEYGFCRIFLKSDPFRGSPAGYMGYYNPPKITGSMALRFASAAWRDWSGPKLIFSNTSANS